MVYNDLIYGKIHFPDFIGELIKLPQMQRLKGISLDSLPQVCVPWKITSRFDHGLGVCALADLVIRQNRPTKMSALTLLAAALLHDAGNPPLSHLGEHFLRKLTGRDGESFLFDMIDGTDSWLFLGKAGVDLERVVRFVTGRSFPWSLVLNGSMDVDNLDNVNRYWFTAKPGQVLFDAPLIASSYHLRGDLPGWGLQEKCRGEARKWQEARRAVYGLVYSEPHLSACMMVFRALHFAFADDKIGRSFFRLDDMSALEFISKCNPDSARLVSRVLAQDTYPELVALETTDPGEKLRHIVSDNPEARTIIANCICEALRLPRASICVYSGFGRDKRRIEIPFVGEEGARFDDGDHKPIFRLKLYADPELADYKKETVKRLFSQMTK
ncbi:MAG: hypothetical protein KGI73_04760 [Patescibacteria group bacterium]|nr:hypothetical protein [Patescibacteria group bacterium]